MTDEELIDASRSGDNDAFKEIVKRYESRVAATVIGMLGKRPEADDVGQEVFIRFYRGLNKFRGEATVGTYLTRIAINLSLNELKRMKKKRKLFLGNTPEEAFDIPDSTTSEPYNEDKEVIQRALQRLEPKFRSVIVLRLVDGYSVKETAEILKLPSGTVLSRLARAQKKLRILLSSYYGEGNEREGP